MSAKYVRLNTRSKCKTNTSIAQYLSDLYIVYRHLQFVKFDVICLTFTQKLFFEIQTKSPCRQTRKLGSSQSLYEKICSQILPITQRQQSYGTFYQICLLFRVILYSFYPLCGNVVACLLLFICSFLNVVSTNKINKYAINEPNSNDGYFII